MPREDTRLLLSESPIYTVPVISPEDVLPLPIILTLPHMRKAPDSLKNKISKSQPIKSAPKDIVRLELSPKLRLTSYCIAQHLDLLGLQEHITKATNHQKQHEFFDDVLYVASASKNTFFESNDQENLTPKTVFSNRNFAINGNANGEEEAVEKSVIATEKALKSNASADWSENAENRSGEAFFFEFGVVVMWGFELEEEKRVLENVKKFSVEPLQEFEFDDMLFCYSSKNEIVGNDEVFIELGPNCQPSKLAVSHACAQSIKLFHFEDRISKTIDDSEILTKSLSQTGAIPFSRSQISKCIGELFQQRNTVNLYSGIIDTPQWFWDHPDQEAAYTMARKYLDVNKRVETLNKKLGFMKELFEILNAELESQHSTRLEWVVILLIAVEIILEIVPMALRVLS